ncbi:MAG: FAD:protein FMN transferase, partial [Candidatus Dadabacteria bacterium]|nr:FAD:protein FMN transferase [Candidatus Dadabacteria bacterium]NIT12895.1 FAD:protein FMN transferase [Candidatus Dadabacteria bacterium]
DNLSVSTSGGYERYFEINGKKYSHIIDPRTGYPVDHFSSVTIVSENPVFADALSTAFSVLSLKESIEIIKHLDKVGILLIEKKHGKVSKYNNDYFKRLSVN